MTNQPHTHQIALNRLFSSFLIIRLLQLGSAQGVSDVQSRGVKSAILMSAILRLRRGLSAISGGRLTSLMVVVLVYIRIGFGVERFHVERTLTGDSKLFVFERGRFGYIQRRSNAHRGAVQMARSDFRYMTRAVHFFIFLTMLIIVVGLQC